MSSIQQPAGSYKFGQQTGTPRTIKNATKLEPYLVDFTDGEGRDQVRVAFRVPDSAHFFIVQEKIQGSFVVTRANDWFNKGLSAKLSKGVESV
jgi:hypothetical protein